MAQNRYNNNSHNRNNYTNHNKQEEIVKINKPLHIYYADKSKLFLEDGVAYNTAKLLQKMPTHQLRKILNQVKLCVQEIENREDNFENIRNKLLMLLPLSAYNKGRNPKANEYYELYKFLVKHLNLESLKTNEDIEVFDQLFTSVIAYHKFLGGK